jgi:hypothetical protein
MTVRVFLCGGTGVNIGKKIKSAVDLVYIDTSTSNLKTVDKDLIMLVEDMDGAGKLRSNTYEKFKDIADDVLIKFKPSNELNIVISSLSGGSGSVISPLIVKRLLEDNKNVLVLAIDSKHSVIEINNTIKTLKTFKSVSNTINKNVSIVYFDNVNRTEIDNKCVSTVELMTLLVDKHRTEEFDISDLHNFLNFDKVTDTKPNVSFVELRANDTIEQEKNTSLVSTILLTKDRNSTITSTLPEYLATCVVTDKDYNLGDVRIDNIVGLLAITIEQLEAQIKDLSDNKRVNKVRTIEVVSENDDGMIL